MGRCERGDDRSDGPHVQLRMSLDNRAMLELPVTDAFGPWRDTLEHMLYVRLAMFGNGDIILYLLYTPHLYGTLRGWNFT
jgi:hypothetical protein